MTEIEQAITQLNDLRRDREALVGGDGDEIYAADIDAINAGIAALREKAEREKGCPICLNRSISLNATSLGNGGIAMTVFAQFCPNCGRMLTGGKANDNDAGWR